MTRREQLAAYGAWLAVCFLWGTTYLAIRIGLETLPPMLFAGLRFLTAGALLFPFVYFSRGARLPKGREWVSQIVIGLMLLGVGNGMVVLAEQWVPSGVAALLVATSPFWVVGLERFFRDGERSSARAIVGLLIGFGGLVLLVAPHLFGAAMNGYYLLGAVAIQVGCASWSAGSVYSKHHQTDLSPFMAAAVQMLIAGVALTLLGTTLGEWRVIHFSARSFSAFAYLIVFGSIVAFGSYTYAMQKLPLSLISMYSYINPVIAVLLGWAVLAEPLGWRVMAATTIILAGVALVKTSPTRAPQETTPLPDSTEAEPRREVLATAQKACSVGTN
ncbi:MAG: EamA family transporter [Pyrinomonadaceae bacterium]|nr:EamA family transporter [Pyrinomonadaceae bacterium]